MTLHRKHSSDPPSSLPSRFSISIKSLSGTNLRRWFHQSHQALINGCSHMVNYASRMYRYLQAVKHHEREERAWRNRATMGYDAPRRAAIGEFPQKGREGTALRTTRITPDSSAAIYQSYKRRREEMAVRAGLRLDEVPYPALWLEGLVRSTEGLPSLPGWMVGFWRMEWPDVVSWLSPFSWWARFWKWYWTGSIPWTWKITFFTAEALWVRGRLSAGFWPCVVVLGQTMMIYYLLH